MKNLDLLIPKTEKVSNWWTWATVTQADPLRIRLDGELEALDMTPDNLVGYLEVGQRVWVQVAGRQLIISGVAGGRRSAGQPLVYIYSNTAQTIPDNEWTTKHGFTSDGATYRGGFKFPNSGVFDIPQSGDYIINSVLTLTGTTAVNPRLSTRALRNGSQVLMENGEIHGNRNNGQTLGLTCPLDAGDTLQFQLLQASGTTNTTAIGPQCLVTLRRLPD